MKKQVRLEVGAVIGYATNIKRYMTGMQETCTLLLRLSKINLRSQKLLITPILNYMNGLNASLGLSGNNLNGTTPSSSKSGGHFIGVRPLCSQ